MSSLCEFRPCKRMAVGAGAPLGASRRVPRRVWPAADVNEKGRGDGRLGAGGRGDAAAAWGGRAAAPPGRGGLVPLVMCACDLLTVRMERAGCTAED